MIHGKHLAFKRECSRGERKGKKQHTQKANANDTLGSSEQRQQAGKKEKH